MLERKDPKKLWELTKVILHVTMGLLYIIIGAYIIDKQWFMSSLPSNVSYALGAVLIVYGIFRIYRIWKNRSL